MNYREKRHELIDACILLLVRLDRRTDISLERIPLADLQDLEKTLKNLLDTADKDHRDMHETHICENEHDSTATEAEEIPFLQKTETLVKTALGGRIG